MPTRRVRVHGLLSKRVRDAAGRPAGRVEELVARVAGGECLVEEYVLGREGLLERLSVSIAGLSGTMIGLLGAHGTGGGRERSRHVPWHLMDLADPRHPRLRCTLAEL